MLSSDTKYPAPIGDRQTEDVGARRIPPVDEPVTRAHRIEIVVLRADEQLVVERQNVVGRAAEPPRPKKFPGFDLERDDLVVVHRYENTVAGERGGALDRPAELLAPDQPAVAGTKRQDCS
jgi:hypothetical protein